jgi:hypothetical protein
MMPIRSSLAVLAVVSAAFCGALAPVAQATRTPGGSSAESALLKALLRSRELWATVDVCDPADQPDTVGVRGSMPGDKHAHDQMYMSFRLQYQDATSKKWFDLPGNAKPSFLHVGGGATVRQGGRSFQLQPQAGKPAFMLRGVVVFQWRRGARVLQSASRPTTAGHRSLAGADPAGFTTAGCLIG